MTSRIAGLAVAMALLLATPVSLTNAAGTANAAGNGAGKAGAKGTKVRAPDPFPIHAVELAYEVSAAQMSLPDAGAGFVLVQPCAKCPTQSLSIDAKSQFQLNGVTLTQAELRRRIGARTDWTATALYTPHEFRLTRLLVVGP